MFGLVLNEISHVCLVSSDCILHIIVLIYLYSIQGLSEEKRANDVFVIKGMFIPLPSTSKASFDKEFFSFCFNSGAFRPDFFSVRFYQFQVVSQRIL